MALIKQWNFSLQSDSMANSLNCNKIVVVKLKSHFETLTPGFCEIESISYHQKKYWLVVTNIMIKTCFAFFSKLCVLDRPVRVPKFIFGVFG